MCHLVADPEYLEREGARSLCGVQTNLAVFPKIEKMYQTCSEGGLPPR